MAGWEFQFRQMLQLLTTPAGLVLVMLGCVLASLALAKPWARLLVLAMMIWSTTLTVSPVETEGFRNVLITPLEQLRQNTRAMTLVCLGILLLPTLAADKGWRLRLFATPVVVFFAFQLVYSSMDVVFAAVTRGILGLAIVIMTLFVIGRGVGSGVKSLDSANNVVKAVAGAAILFVTACAVQGIINPDAVKHSGRFYGTTSNPQFASTTIGVMLPVACYLVIQKGIGKLWRLTMCGTIGLLVVFLLWTGSRTGLLMCIIGVVSLFRLRLGKGLIAAAAAAVALLVGLQFFGGELEGADRLLSTQDTRTGAWIVMWEAFQTNPLVGVNGGDELNSENSILWTLARYGLVGFLPLLAAIGAFLWYVLRLQMIRGSLDKPHRLLADLVASVILTVGAGSLFEGYLLGQFNVAVFTLLTITTVGEYLFDARRAGRLGEDFYDNGPHYSAAPLDYSAGVIPDAPGGRQYDPAVI